MANTDENLNNLELQDNAEIAELFNSTDNSTPVTEIKTVRIITKTGEQHSHMLDAITFTSNFLSRPCIKIGLDSYDISGLLGVNPDSVTGNPSMIIFHDNIESIIFTTLLHA